MKSLLKKNIRIDEISSIAERIITIAKEQKSVTAKAVTLSGDLGAGKTTLTQAIAKMLGVKENLISPTFVIMKKYKTNDAVLKNLIHIDAYRLEKSSELENLGWKELIANPDNLIILEWPERVPECERVATLKVHLEHLDEETRSIDILV